MKSPKTSKASFSAKLLYGLQQLLHLLQAALLFFNQIKYVHVSTNQHLISQKIQVTVLHEHTTHAPVFYMQATTEGNAKALDVGFH
jgi:hypothetical protein